MSDQEKFWFHCGRCGALFQSEAAESHNRLCPECGFDPCTGIQEPAGEDEKPAQSVEPRPARNAVTRGHRGKRISDKDKYQHITLKLMAGWTLLLAVIVFGARKLWPDAQPDHPATTTTEAVAPEVAEQDAVLLQSAFPKCAAAFSEFLATPTPESRSQFVLNPATTVSRMTRFYSLNPWTYIDPSTLELTGRSVVHLPGTTAIETRWKSQDGQQVDAIFRQENDEWRLDWEQFARYGDFPWPLFLAGSGPEEAEFRLLARERLPEERKEESTISIVLYAPKFGHPDETGFQSPEFLVPRDSRDGRLLAAAFKLAREQKRVYGSLLPDLNPDDMTRLRLTIRRSETEQGRRFEISSIAACHWYSIDDPGVDTDLPPIDGVIPAPEVPAPAPENP